MAGRPDAGAAVSIAEGASSAQLAAELDLILARVALNLTFGTRLRSKPPSPDA